MLLALPAAPASAASPKVLLVTRNEEGNGPPAAQGEPALVNNFINWPAAQAECGGTDEGATVGENPAATVKVSGSDAPVDARCLSETAPELVPGSITIKSVSVAKSGAVKLTGKLEVTPRRMHLPCDEAHGHADLRRRRRDLGHPQRDREASPAQRFDLRDDDSGRRLGERRQQRRLRLRGAAHVLSSARRRRPVRQDTTLRASGSTE